MNVYDFDNTVFRPDSSYAFCMFCLRRYPRILLRSSAGGILPLYRYLSGGRTDATPMKEGLFSFLRYLPDPDEVVHSFWEENLSGFQQWYLDRKRSDDVIISASPDFLLKDITENFLGVHLIATRMDSTTGNILGMNCHDRQKVIRFREEYPWAKIDAFYSDSLFDAPMAGLAERAFFVTKKGPKPWPEHKELKRRSYDIHKKTV